MKWMLYVILCVAFGITIAEAGADPGSKWFWISLVIMWALMVVQYMD